jgi:hypothetical protein
MLILVPVLNFHKAKEVRKHMAARSGSSYSRFFSVRAMACDITALESPDCFREAIIPLITKM